MRLQRTRSDGRLSNRRLILIADWANIRRESKGGLVIVTSVCVEKFAGRPVDVGPWYAMPFIQLEVF